MSEVKIVLSGGGTLGPVTPLLAVRETVRKIYPHTNFIWVGTKTGPERLLVEKYQIPYFAITSGKWRRYFSLHNFFDTFKIIWAFFESVMFLVQEKPCLVVTAGGFVSVPLHYAAALLGIPSWVHQQDVIPGLANKLMARTATKITVALSDSLRYFPKNKTTWIGNPARSLNGINSASGKEFFGFNAAAPVIFVLGGGTGSARLNQMLIEALPAWPKDWQVIHLVGKERSKETAYRVMGVFPNYHAFEFFTSEMSYAYAAADVVVGRAGFNTITELALLSKASILLPKPGHQEANARFLEKNKATIVMDENTDNGLKLAQLVKELVFDSHKRTELGTNLHRFLPIASNDNILKILRDLKIPLR